MCVCMYICMYVYLQIAIGTFLLSNISIKSYQLYTVTRPCIYVYKDVFRHVNVLTIRGGLLLYTYRCVSQSDQLASCCSCSGDVKTWFE